MLPYAFSITFVLIVWGTIVLLNERYNLLSCDRFIMPVAKYIAYAWLGFFLLAMAFLVWNLFLAAVPFGAALVLEALEKLRAWTSLQWCCLVVWLLFLPNAPYIVTDLVHLRQRSAIPLWYDILLLISRSAR